MNDDTKIEELDSATPQAPNADKASEAKELEGEFKITVRKLEMPVQPRGVLAD
jgi:hypothetical protein